MAQTQTSVQKKTSKTTIKHQPKAPRTRTAIPKKAASTRNAPQALEAQSAPEVTVIRPKGKLGQMLALIESADGATLDELSAALSWLPHTARAAITGLRKRGFAIALTTEADRKAYRIVG